MIILSLNYITFHLVDGGNEVFWLFNEQYKYKYTFKDKKKKKGLNNFFSIAPNLFHRELQH